MTTTLTRNADEEVERLANLSPDELTAEDVSYLRRIRDTRASLLECEKELEEVKERRKLRKETFEEAVLQAAMYFDKRQLAFNFAK